MIVICVYADLLQCLLCEPHLQLCGLGSPAQPPHLLRLPFVLQPLLHNKSSRSCVSSLSAVDVCREEQVKLYFDKVKKEMPHNSQLPCALK